MVFTKFSHGNDKMLFKLIFMENNNRVVDIPHSILSSRYEVVDDEILQKKKNFHYSIASLTLLVCIVFIIFLVL